MIRSPEIFGRVHESIWNLGICEVYFTPASGIVTMVRQELLEECDEFGQASDEPIIYISPEGNWGDATGLMLLTRSVVEKVGGLSVIEELYDRLRDDLFIGVRERLG